MDIYNRWLMRASEEKKNEIMEEMCGNIGRAISNNSQNHLIANQLNRKYAG